MGPVRSGPAFFQFLAHMFISDWMEKNKYPAVNSEKNIFMCRVGNDFILHGLFELA
jgi:hypothetical protein